MTDKAMIEMGLSRLDSVHKQIIGGQFFVICFITWLIPAKCEELDDNVCVLCDYVDNFLHSFAPLY